VDAPTTKESVNIGVLLIEIIVTARVEGTIACLTMQRFKSPRKQLAAYTVDVTTYPVSVVVVAVVGVVAIVAVVAVVAVVNV
jgi:hypothetical protein